ncbi:unnamed protein product [Rhodiola kirilowii]
MEGCGRGGPINPSSPFDGGEQLDVKYHPEPSTSTDFFTATTLGLDDTMPFLQLLQTLYPNNILNNNQVKAENKIVDLDSCITHDMQELHSPVMSSEAKKLTQVAEEEEEKREFNSVNELCRNDFSSERIIPQLKCSKMRKANKRVKEVVENKKDAEKQRMTHIAVERNRRRQMSEYLGFLRSLLPPAYAAKGDQASIVGGVIDYVKKLEQHLQTLQAKKRQKNMDELVTRSSSSKSVPMLSTSSSSSSASLEEDDADMKPPQLEKKADINIMVVQTHVNLHIECDDMKQNQLIKFLVALENLGLTILHLNITSILHKSSFYSLSLKVEDECKVRSAEEISGSVEKVLNSLNIYNGARSSVRNQNQDDDDDDDDARNGRDE